VVLASSFKGAFRTANAPTSFSSAAYTVRAHHHTSRRVRLRDANLSWGVQCGVDVAKLEYKDLISADYNLHMVEPEQVLLDLLQPHISIA
jgi:hypothetical protein